MKMSDGAPDDQLRCYLEMIRTARQQARSDGCSEVHDHEYCGVEDFLLRHGLQFPVGRVQSFGEMGACYRNAFMAVVEHREWSYAEGVALSGIGFPTEHAWCVDECGRVVETTWPDGLAYLGVRFDYAYIQKRIFETECAMPALADWENGWPILTQPELAGKVVLELREAR